MSSNLAIKLRIGTQQAHTNAEHTDFMRRFLKGAVDKNAFGKLLGNLYYIYSQLEAELNFYQNHPWVSPVYFPQLNRTASLEQDLDFFYGENWKEKITPTIAAQAYISRIQEVSATEPVLLIAHAYTRYMGDLSGGQMLKKIAESALGLENHQGVSFYEFNEITDLSEFKVKYRLALDSVPIDEAMSDKVVVEANISFNLNIQLLRELERGLVAAVC
jgi:heme oxygenase (biliverdin-producing, ferredoxin)